MTIEVAVNVDDGLHLSSVFKLDFEHALVTLAYEVIEVPPVLS